MFFLRLFLLVLFSYFISPLSAQNNLNQFVNPFIGTGGHGHTFPGAVLPFGMVQLSPDTRIDGSWDGCGGYHYSDSSIYGFSHTHLSGTGVSDWGDILVMPAVGKPSLDNKIYASKFDHKNEKASPGFYEVVLKDNNIKAELTATLRTGIHRYTFPKTTEANVILDLLHRDKTTNCNITIIDSITVSGFRESQAWASDQLVFFVIKFSKPFYKSGLVFATKPELPLYSENNKRATGAYFQFDQTDNKPLLVKVAISSVSTEGALKNLEAEATHWDFDKYRSEAESSWNEQLKKIEITDVDKEKLTVFYTALYHCFIHPSLNMDVDNKYRGRDNKIHTATGFTNYSVFSLWDTYRALHPLFTIIERKRTTDFMNTFLAQYDQSQRLPMWELSGNETNCMIGFHAVSVIADAMVKGISGFDSLAAYNAAKAAANYSAFGLPAFNKKGFLQIDDESESVSKTLEYGYDDWCIAQIAKKLNKVDEADHYLKLAQGYKNLFDASTGFMRPRKNGNWLSPFYPNEINNHFTEGNSWQYSFYVPHDIEGLIALHGGNQKFETKLDELFCTKEKTRGRVQSDVTGLIGQYAHGNEPSQHMAYLYNFVDKPQKTAERVHQICNRFYKNTPDGLIGNEDCGQMSAWYVFSAIGMYPICPGSTQYALVEPLFSATKINLENGTSFAITKKKKKDELISGINLNGNVSFSSFIEHDSIMKGGVMEYVYSANTQLKIDHVRAFNIPHSASDANTIIPVPIIKSAAQIFKDSLVIAMYTINSPATEIRFTTDGKVPTRTSKLFDKPFFISKNVSIKARAFYKSDSSNVAEATFFKLKYNYDVQLISKPNSQYAAYGAQSLIDGFYGDTDWRKGNWLGFQPQDFECVVDLKSNKKIESLSLNCLQDTRSWILFPTVVYFYGANDNKHYTLLDSVVNSFKADDYIVKTNNFRKKFQQKVDCRYLKIVAKNFGKLPEWHTGKGEDAFIFVDEIEIN